MFRAPCCTRAQGYDNIFFDKHELERSNFNDPVVPRAIRWSRVLGGYRKSRQGQAGRGTPEQASSSSEQESGVISIGDATLALFHRPVLCAPLIVLISTTMLSGLRRRIAEGFERILAKGLHKSLARWHRV